MNNSSKIRNFGIIAHIDHGKSTLADRMLEQTQTVDKRLMKEQLLDQMDLERERGITIKLQPVTMSWQGYTLNLIDTPGHVDFGYEVSRSLAAVEGVVLLVDASQGIQAQTLTTLNQAIDQNLTIVPVVNKIDLPNAEPERVAQELIDLLKIKDEEIIFASGKTGEGVAEILDRIITTIPAPMLAEGQPLKAMIFDSVYDSYRGVISYIRVFEGSLKNREQIVFMSNDTQDQALEVGIFQPKMTARPDLAVGMIGYVVTGVKDVSAARVGDTITGTSNRAQKPLVGYKEVVPMVYAGMFAADGDVVGLRDALEKLKLNDSSLSFEPDSSKAFGLGFRCGFLGLLHMEIVTERLEREFNLELIVTTPSVAHKEVQDQGKKVYSEPWVKVEIVVPQQFLGSVMEIAQARRGKLIDTVYLSDDGQSQRAVLSYELPLAEVIVNFYDKLKSVSSGYASMNYEFIEYRADSKLIKLSILVAGEEIDELAMIVHSSEAQTRGREITEKLKELIPQQNFEVTLQAAIGGKIIARETIKALRKDVTAKLYGGDRSRKDKLLKKQKAGKKRLKKLGKVDIPSDVFIKLLK
ncbi:translation elongation factor 4 [Candidatus Berkelbacteria bacterium]|nr:translation elongation factor 4 [Candidatus Berkelbacteria bacterium]